MEINIKGEAKEIAALAVAMQGRQTEVSNSKEIARLVYNALSEDLPNCTK